jgi:hypothetical protein
MSFVKVEAVRAIKMNNKTYRSAKEAAIAYANLAILEFHCRKQERNRSMTGPERYEWGRNIHAKLIRRSLPIFTRYFKGK